MANGSAKTTTNLNLRSGPGTGSSILYTIPGQTSITLTGIPNNGWYPVTVNGKSGYVSGKYLTGISEYTSGTGTNTGTPPQVEPTPTAGFDAEYEKYLTDQGFGGLNRRGDFGRSLVDRAKSGYAAAQLNNPALTNRQYLNGLGGDFLAKARAAATPQQRGEQYGIMAPRARWTSRIYRRRNGRHNDASRD